MHIVYPPKFYIINFSQFLLTITVVPSEIKDVGYVKFWGVNKFNYCLGKNADLGLNQTKFRLP